MADNYLRREMTVSGRHALFVYTIAQPGIEHVIVRLFYGEFSVDFHGTTINIITYTQLL